MRRALLCLLLALVASGVRAESSQFKLLRQIPIGGEGGWDYLTLDAAGHRLFVSHATRVVVLDTKSDSIVGEIPDTPGIHGVALAYDLGRGFTSNGRDSSVSMFDLKTLKPTARITLQARNPDAICYDPFSHRVFTFNGGSANATAIDASTGKVIDYVALGGKPEFAVVDLKGHLWVNLEDSSAVVELDTRSLKVLAHWPLSPGEEPTGLAIDRDSRRLFSSCSNQKLLVLDADKGKVVAVLPIGNGVDAAAFDPGRKLVYTSNGEGTLTVIHEDGPDRYSQVATVQTQRGARTMALDEGSGTIYTATSDFGPPPEPTAERPHPRPSLVPGTFRVLVVGK
jgi:WD40 repeat protein